MGRNLNLSVFSRNYEGNKFASCANSQVALCADKWLELLPAQFVSCADLVPAAAYSQEISKVSLNLFFGVCPRGAG